jgi:hypothetical protein
MKHFSSEAQALKVLELGQFEIERRVILAPAPIIRTEDRKEFEPTERQADAIDYLVHEWGYKYAG